MCDFSLKIRASSWKINSRSGIRERGTEPRGVASECEYTLADTEECKQSKNIDSDATLDASLALSRIKSCRGFEIEIQMLARSIASGKSFASLK
jgi:hypothetical protein